MTDIVGKVKYDNYKQQHYIDGTLLAHQLPDPELVNEEESE